MTEVYKSDLITVRHDFMAHEYFHTIKELFCVSVGGKKWAIYY